MTPPKLSQNLLATLLLGACLLGTTGCTIGYRYHHIDDATLSERGTRGDIKGGGHMVELGLVLDVRYLRLVMPYMGASYEMELQASDGAQVAQSTMIEKRGFRLDVPALSIWNGKTGWGPGYPGIMKHRQSVEIWLSATGRVDDPLLGFADLGLVYYHHDLVAVRAFGGWGGAPFKQTSSTYGLENRRPEFWKTSATGPTGGVELTIGAGEQALDFIMYFLGTQKKIEDKMR
ncbi:hypothetical protein [Bradymonas sediminis]|uniref:Uncharacterized protein n=1 Tax=Bradymonas sediminis TaxID=1548548 RepID=A0A2Z4FPX9_9DELT|nr:hypothetical protein [Bradymonas sediminis]AWV90728.1 hypothetical protein DN745_15965 [Bradymonas sediminis]TDP62630.1 hypothetical protein DFR33_11233 [Bradymonas sediminis]